MVNNKGLWYAFGAYLVWGLFPLYWKLLHHVNAFQLISHRIIWSFIILIIFIASTSQLDVFLRAIKNRKVLLIYLVAALLIGINWLVYVWAVNANFIIETSLGYFINPLVVIVFGVVFLGERLRVEQWVAVALAASGVVYLAWTAPDASKGRVRI